MSEYRTHEGRHRQSGFSEQVADTHTTDNHGKMRQWRCRQASVLRRELVEKRVMARMRDAGLEPNLVTFDTLMKAYALASDVDGAERVMIKIQERDDMKPALRSFNILMFAYAKNLDLNGMEEVMERLSKANLEPNKYSYTILMSFHAVMGQFVEAERIMQTLQDAGITPDAVVYSTLHKAYKTANRHEDASDTRSVMSEMGFELQDDGKNQW